MTWEKSSPELIEAFAAALPDDPRIERRKMFGYPCAFVNGNMFTGLHEQNFIIRLAEDDRAAFVSEMKTGLFEPFPGRVMKEYAVVPPAVRADRKTLGEWMARSLAYAASLPPKEKKPRRKKAKG